jgi:hypothetical protein
MNPTPVRAESRIAAQSDATADLAAAFARAARAVGVGERRSWDLPETADAAVITAQVATRLRHLLTGPWCLDATSVDAVFAQFALLVADAVRPGRVEALCHTARHRQPTVYLAVSAWRDGALQPARIARVETSVGSAS